MSFYHIPWIKRNDTQQTARIKLTLMGIGWGIICLTIGPIIGVFVGMIMVPLGMWMESFSDHVRTRNVWQHKAPDERDHSSVGRTSA